MLCRSLIGSVVPQIRRRMRSLSGTAVLSSFLHCPFTFGGETSGGGKTTMSSTPTCTKPLLPVRLSALLCPLATSEPSHAPQPTFRSSRRVYSEIRTSLSRQPNLPGSLCTFLKTRSAFFYLFIFPRLTRWRSGTSDWPCSVGPELYNNTLNSCQMVFNTVQ